jgi:hypothetical protein
VAKTTPALTLSDFDAAEQRPGSKCWFQVKLTTEQQTVVAAAHAAGRTNGAISRVLQEKLGIHVNVSAVRHHFAEECRCGR